MGQDTKIQWAHHTFNPWRGCTKVSAGCQFCYAERGSKRNPKSLGEWGPRGTRVVAAESYWRQPAAWNKAAANAGERHRVFCASVADVFEGEDTMPASEWPKIKQARQRLFDLIDATPNLDWLLLTKRPENIQRISRGAPANVWFGTSVENQETADARIPHLLQCPAAVRFLSVEPLLGPMVIRSQFLGESSLRDIRHLHATGSPAHVGTHAGQREYSRDFAANSDGTEHGPGINWIIVGGESGPSARPCNVAWIRSIIRQCKDAGVACFAKQVGSNPNWAADDYWESGPPNDPKGGDMEEWPEDLRVREMPQAPYPTAQRA